MTRNPYLAHGAVLISSALLLLTPGFGIAQTAATATLLGTVTDPSGAAVAGATIELTDQSRHETRRQMVNAEGAYSITGVLPGGYSVSAAARGFKQSIVPNITVDVSKSYVVNFQLEIGTRAESVEVTASASIELQSTRAGSPAGKTINTRHCSGFTIFTRICWRATRGAPSTAL